MIKLMCIWKSKLGSRLFCASVPTIATPHPNDIKGMKFIHRTAKYEISLKKRRSLTLFKTNSIRSSNEILLQMWSCVSNIYAFVIDPHNDRLPIGPTVQPVEHSTGITEVHRVQVPFRAEFFRSFFHYCLSSIAKLWRSSILKLYYYYYHFGWHWENKNWKKKNDNKTVWGIFISPML